MRLRERTKISSSEEGPDELRNNVINMNSTINNATFYNILNIVNLNCMDHMDKTGLRATEVYTCLLRVLMRTMMMVEFG